MTVLLMVDSLYKVTLHLSRLIEMETVVAFYYMSARTYQLKLSTVIFQHLKAIMLKLIFARKNGCQLVSITSTEIISVIIWMLLLKH